jgi:hypothetical protein
MSTIQPRTTVSINKTTKAKLDKWRATGQCYDGFLCQLVSLWEKMHDDGSVNEMKIPQKMFR